MTGKEHVALAMGDLGPGQPILCRLHSECLTGDCLFSLRCDCGPQLQAAMQRIAEEGQGLILYLRQEGALAYSIKSKLMACRTAEPIRSKRTNNLGLLPMVANMTFAVQCLSISVSTRCA